MFDIYLSNTENLMLSCFPSCSFKFSSILLFSTLLIMLSFPSIDIRIDLHIIKVYWAIIIYNRILY